jgi:hypothetical protein
MIGIEPTSPPTTKRNRWQRVVVMVAVLLAAEMGARLIEPLLPATKGWPTPQMAAKVDQMTELTTNSTNVNVVFLGSSSMDQDVNPAIFNREAEGLISYNASLNGLSMRSLELWALDVVLPILDPEIVVLGLTTRELNDGGRRQDELFDQLVASVSFRNFSTKSDDELFSQAEDLSALVRIRDALRIPYTTLLRLLRVNRGEVVSLPGPFGQRIPEERDYVYDFSDRWQEEWTTKDMRDFAMGGIEREALERLLAEMADQGRQVVILPLPISPDYASVQPGGIGSISEFQTLLASAAGSYGATFIEPRLELKSSDFRDPAHLSPNAAEEFAIVLAEDLASLVTEDAMVPSSLP